MKQLFKRGLACLLVLVMVVGLLPAVTFTADAASYIYNWGKRGETATELSDTAESWYAKNNTSYEKLSAYSGASIESAVPNSALYSQLKTLMSNAHSYKTSYEATKELYRYTDCQNGGGKISSFYSGTAIGPGWGEGGSWNREHTWPNSKGLGGQDENDIMMLRPTSTSENSSRGNDAYGKSASYYDPNDESGGKYNLHGDVARICLYVYVRWGNTSRMWGSAGVMESKDVLLEWMEEDPVDTWELGRNDAVQSITGTRNVFVDYPELAFDLFNAPVPDGYDTPSGGTPSYNIAVQVNNTSYGSATLSGKTITATPKTGYLVSGCTVVSGNATVTRVGTTNVFTVAATSDCTIRVNFAAREKTSLTFVDMGRTVSTQTPYIGDSATLPAYTGNAPSGFVFRGWVDQQIVSTDKKPAIYSEGASYQVTGNKTFYALYAKVEDGSTGEVAYRLVTDASQLSEGMSVVITAGGTTQVGMKPTGGTNNRYAGSVVKNSDDTISFVSGTPMDELTLGAGAVSGTYSFYSEENGQYLAAGTSSGSNVLRMQASVDAAASFTISIASDGTATVVSKTSSDRNKIQYNSSVNIFSCYSSGQKAISLYAAMGGGVSYYTTSPIVCDHENIQNVAAVAATCEAGGFTAGVLCNDCDTYISGREPVPATGHSWNSGVITTEATCTTAGVKTYTCTNCGETKTASIPASGHSWNSGVITTPATCTDNGVKTYTCSACGGTKTESVSATGHSYVLSGNTYTCPACGDSYDVYFISFSVPYGVDKVNKIEYTDGGIVLPEADAPTGEYTYTFEGWAEKKIDNEETAPTVYKAGQKYTATGAVTLYAVYSYTVGGSGGSGNYVKVTEAPQDWSGEYLIVYETESCVFNSTLSKLDAANNNKKVTISNNTISAAEGDPYKFTIETMDGGYSVKASNGKYIGRTSTSNGLEEGTSAQAHTITLDSSGNAKLTTKSGMILRFNNLKDQLRFRYYKSGQQAIQLYVKAGSIGTTYYTTVLDTECQHTNEVYETLDPTCTEDGYTSIYCADCGEFLATEDTIPATGHSYESTVTPPTATEQGYTTHTCTVCGDSYVDSYVDPVVAPTGAAALQIRGASLTLGSDLKVVFTVNKETLDTFENVYFVFRFAGKEIIMDAPTGTNAKGQYLYAMPGVAPRMMNDLIEIELYGTYQGVQFQYTNTYKAVNYCYTQLGKSTTKVALKALIVDLLNFATAHQVYMSYNVENPANWDLTDDQKALAGTHELNCLNQQTMSGTDNGAAFKGATLTLSDAVIVRYTVECADLTDDVTLNISVGGKSYEIPASEFIPTGTANRYYVNFKNLYARQMREVITSVVCRNGEPISQTATYSVDTFVSKQTKADVVALCKAMMYYGDAAKAYLG